MTNIFVRDFEETLEEIQYEINLKHAIKQLPDLERNVFSFVINVDVEMAKQSDSYFDYVKKSAETTPVSLAADHFDMIESEIKRIVRNAQRMVKQIMMS